MDKEIISKVYCNDCFIIEKGYFYFATKLDNIDITEYTYSRIYYFFMEGRTDGLKGWYNTGFVKDIVSVCLKPKTETEPRKQFFITAQGEVRIAIVGSETYEKIPNSGSYDGRGAMSQIKEIDNIMYACGFGGQVYKRIEEENWVSIDNDGKIAYNDTSNEINLCGISGIDKNNIFVVGFNGKILKFNDETWTEIISNSTEHLERIVCVTKDEMYVCGKNGTLLKGNQNGFINVSNPEISADFWGIEYFNGKVYLASLTGLFIYEENEIKKLKTGLEPEITGYRLDSRDGILLSGGGYDFAFFDGVKWERLIHPDNA